VYRLFAPNTSAGRLCLLFSAEQPSRSVRGNAAGAVEHHRLPEVDIAEITAVLRSAGLGRLTDHLAPSDVVLELVGELAFFAGYTLQMRNAARNTRVAVSAIFGTPRSTVGGCAGAARGAGCGSARCETAAIGVDRIRSAPST